VQPPWTRDGKLGFDLTRPSGEWERESSFRSVEECEEGKHRLLELFVDGRASGPQAASIGRAIVSRLAVARCVPDDSPQ
jgi:hypothetical protein